MKAYQKIGLTLTTLSVFSIIILQAQTFKYPEKKEINQRVNYLERVISEPLVAENEIYELGYESAEFMLFTYSFSSYALTSIALDDEFYRDIATKIIGKSIVKVLNKEIYSTYGVNQSPYFADTIPDCSVLYLGHLNLMLGCYRLISGDNRLNILNDKISKSLYTRYRNTPFMNLESYDGSIWIPDNTVAIASLKLYSENTQNNYDALCNDWVAYAKRHYIDKNTGVLFSTINSETGESMEEPRGSMLGWSIMFIYQFDEDFAVELYNNYKKYFSNNRFGFKLFQERHNSKTTSDGDIDSGPIVRGYSIPANEFALSNAVLAGDYKTAKKLERLINFGTKTIIENNELRYELKFTDMKISPMAEALVLHSMTIRQWTKESR
jgi:hypothetical protein